MLRQELKGQKLQRGRESHQGELSSAAAFTLGIFADSRCGQEAEILGFAPAEEPLPGDGEGKSFWRRQTNSKCERLKKTKNTHLKENID